MSRYIDAEALDNRIKADWAKQEDDKGYGLAHFYIETQPTADVAPVIHGHWETIFDELWNYGFEKCSACGDKYGSFTYRYCPNCGAKMDERCYEDA